MSVINTVLKTLAPKVLASLAVARKDDAINESALKDLIWSAVSYNVSRSNKQ
jgi:hypothetical protein